MRIKSGIKKAAELFTYVPGMLWGVLLLLAFGTNRVLGLFLLGFLVWLYFVYRQTNEKERGK